MKRKRDRRRVQVSVPSSKGDSQDVTVGQRVDQWNKWGPHEHWNMLKNVTGDMKMLVLVHVVHSLKHDRTYIQHYKYYCNEIQIPQPPFVQLCVLYVKQSHSSACGRRHCRAYSFRWHVVKGRGVHFIKCFSIYIIYIYVWRKGWELCIFSLCLK